MDIIIKAAQLILSLSILVILHEFGHFFFARVFKTRVEKFYLFFNPGFTLFKVKKGETEYGVGWLPLGGYVKIAGMIDESMDKEQLKLPPQPYEFRAKPAWQRLMIMVGGVLVNFITAMLIFWMILFKWGSSYYPVEEATYGLQFHPVAHEIGLQDGDNVLMVDTFKVETTQDIARFILLEDAHELTVKRGDSTFKVAIPQDFDQKMMAQGVKAFAAFQLPIQIDSIVPGLPADEAGLLKGDKVVAVNEVSTPYFHLFEKEIRKNVGREVLLAVKRGDQSKMITCRVNENGKIGVGNVHPNYFFNSKVVKYGFWEAMPAGIKMGFKILVGYVKQLKLIFTKEGVKQLGGFGTMGSLFPTTWDWTTFWYNTGLISLILAFMNILPIPALDGGHVLFLLYEIVSGRKPSEKFLEYAQITGMILLFSLLLYANGNDIFKAIFN